MSQGPATRPILIVTMLILATSQLIAVNRNHFYSEWQMTTLRDFLCLFYVFFKCWRSSVALRRRSLRHIVNQALVVFLLGFISVICVQCNCERLGRCCATLCPPVYCACLLYWWSIFSLPHAIAQGVMWLLWSVSLSVCHHANWWYRWSRSIYNSVLDVNNGNRRCWDSPFGFGSVRQRRFFIFGCFDPKGHHQKIEPSSSDCIS